MRYADMRLMFRAENTCRVGSACAFPTVLIELGELCIIICAQNTTPKSGLKLKHK